MSDGDFSKTQINQAQVRSVCGRSLFAGDLCLGQAFCMAKFSLTALTVPEMGVTKANASPGPSSVSKGCKLRT